MIFNKFYHPIAVQIYAHQDLENVSLSGNFHNTVNSKRYRRKVSREAINGVMRYNSFRFYICGLSGQHSFRNYDIPTGNFAVPCRVSFSTIVSILRRYLAAEFL